MKIDSNRVMKDSYSPPVTNIVTIQSGRIICDSGDIEDVVVVDPWD